MIPKVVGARQQGSTKRSRFSLGFKGGRELSQERNRQGLLQAAGPPWRGPGSAQPQRAKSQTTKLSWPAEVEGRPEDLSGHGLGHWAWIGKTMSDLAAWDPTSTEIPLLHHKHLSHLWVLSKHIHEHKGKTA